MGKGRDRLRLSPGQQKNYFCCPKGYLNLCERGGFHVCSSKSCDQLPKGDD